MGHSQADKTESHGRIVKVAATRFREAGVDGVGVADLMKAAGLTHGGFYRHFASRDELVAEAIERALDDGSAAVSTIANRKHAALPALIDAYLSVAHRDGLATSWSLDGGRSAPTRRHASLQRMRDIRIVSA
jgi:TetR/AcrR family transcriptional repressor of nem operon